MTIFDHIRGLLSNKVRPFIIELGGCDGNETVTISQMLPGCNYVVLEPVPELAKIIRERKELGKNVTVIQKAIGREDGTTTLYVSSGTSPINNQSFFASSSIKHPLNAEKVFEGMKFEKTRCEVVTLDTLWKERGSHIIDFIFADLQGAEKDMILGGIEALKHTRYLYTEIDLGDYYEDSVQLSGMLEMLPGWIVVEDYGTDVLLKNTRFE